MGEVCDQDKDDDFLSLVVYPPQAHLQMGFVHMLTRRPIRDFFKLYVFSSPVREASRESTPRPSIMGTPACKVPRTLAGLGQTKGKVPGFWSPFPG